MPLEISSYDQLKKISLSLGAGLFGVADISAIKSEFILSEEIKKRIDKAVCIGVKLSSLVLSEIQQEPTRLYFHHYKTVNTFLDLLAFKISSWIEEKGYSAMPIPGSQIIDWERQRAHLSHREVGHLAGLGWWGRNNLLVSEKFGSQFRIATILTDMKLKTDEPVKKDCGECFDCLNACPAVAIKESREKFDYQACREKLKNFQKQNIVPQFICGVCVKACGGGKNGKK